MADIVFQMIMFFFNTLGENSTFKPALTANQLTRVQELKSALESEQEEEEVIRLVRVLMWSLIAADYPVDCVDQFQDPAMQFLIARSLMHDGGMKICTAITSEVAGIQYNWRLFFLKECMEIAKRENRKVFE
jgi:hypothetical protein